MAHTLLPQLILSGGHDPVSKYGKVKVCLYSLVILMIYRTHIKIGLQTLKDCLHLAYNIVIFPYLFFGMSF